MSDADRIVRLLEKNTSAGHRLSSVFDDWLDLVHNSLASIPRHFASAVNEGKFAQETPEETALFARLRAKYTHNSYWDNFSQAFGILLRNTEGFWDPKMAHPEPYGFDLLGAVYMLTSANEHAGQFFTPWSVADLMAQMTIGDGFAQVTGTLKAALAKATTNGGADSVMLEVAILLSAALPDKDEDYLAYGDNYVFPLLRPFADPITICDPCVGSGVMLLTAARRFPSGLSGMASFSSTAWTSTPPASRCAKPISCCTVSQGDSPPKMRSPRRQK